MKKKKIFIIIAVYWLVIFAGLIAFKEFTLRTGTEVLLESRPVDPRDLFRGDYVALAYKIGVINYALLNGQSFADGDRIYVLLRIDENGKGIPVAVSKNRPKEGVFIKGTVVNRRPRYDNNLEVVYGIESYFVPEGTGRDIEKNIEDVYTKVVVDAFGHAVIKSLVVNGKEVK